MNHPSHEDIFKAADSYDNSWSSMAEGTWVPAGFRLGCAWYKEQVIVLNKKKPILELQNDTNACIQLAEFVNMEYIEHSKDSRYAVFIYGVNEEGACSLAIYEDGDIFLTINGVTQVLDGAFHIVKLILSLGYDVETNS